MTGNLERKPSITIYCHFSFKRPKGKDYGLFSVAFYSDYEGKKLITHLTRKYDLWKNHQFVTAIQSYSHALQTIYEMQGQMRAANINQVMLVTDNSTLAGWIVDHKKNKAYTAYMEQAVKPYRTGSYKEIVIGVGLCNPRQAEKSYKYCKEELVENDYKPETKDEPKPTNYKIDINSNNSGYKSILDIISDDKSIPKVTGITEL